jgi:RNA polymerase-binding transcription factor DksA
VYDALRGERERTAEQIAALTADFDSMVAAAESSNTDDEHDPEGATIAFERAQIIAVLEHSQARLAEIDHALERLAADTYGTCERCAQPIATERLVARPSATTCITCAARR